MRSAFTLSDRPWRLRPSLLWAVLLGTALGACGGGGSGGTPGGEVPSTGSPVPSAPMPMPTPTPPPTAIVLRAPVLSFNDTGLSVSDGITSNGLWSVATEFGWEFSLDQGRSWTRGTGTWFEVRGDGPKSIWVRARDDAGNTSEIVIVSCVLDTQAPTSVSVIPGLQGVTRVLQLAGLEPGARWEYSFDGQTNWVAGSGPALGILGNDLARLWLRQVDLAGNVSPPQSFMLDAAGADGWHEASGDPLRPSLLAPGTLTLLIHGSVVRGDADYVRWDIPANHRLESVRLVRYQSDDLIAFYALQASSVFDAGFDVSRMLSWGHLGPADLARNVLANVAANQRGAGPMTLWFQQTGPLPTAYVVEVRMQPIP